MNNALKLIDVGFLALVLIVGGGVSSCAAYNSVRVWNATTAGEAELAQATQNRKIAVLEAQAKMESATLIAKAEVERAKGVAAANDIIMGRLGGPQNYLAYLQIEAMKDSKASIIYVPTEAGIPITEAGQRPRPQ